MIVPELKVDAKDLIGFLGALSEAGEVATVVALNRTAEWGDKAGRDGMRERFMIREPRLLNVIFPVTIPKASAARKGRLAVSIAPADGTNAQARIAKIFTPFEEGAAKGIDRYGRLPAIPSTGFLGLRRTPETKIPKQFFPQNLGLSVRIDPAGKAYYALGRGAIRKSLSPTSVTKTGKVQRRGKLGTFQIDGARGPVILQRYGPHRGDVRALWFLRPSVRRPPILDFVDTITKAVDDHWEHEMLTAFEYYSRIAESRR